MVMQRKELLMKSPKELKVAYMVPHYASLSEGSSLRSVAIARGIACEFDDVVVIAPNTRERSMEYREETTSSDGIIKIRYVSGFSVYRKSFVKRLAHEFLLGLNSLRLLKEAKPDLILVGYPPAFMPLSALVYKLLFSVPVVLEVRDLMAGALTASGYSRSRWVSRAAQYYENMLLKYSDAIAPVSPGMESQFTKYSKKKFKILPSFNGIEDTMLNFSGEELDFNLRAQFEEIKKHIQLRKGERLVVYAGALTQSYDIETILHGFSRLNEDNVKLLILGDGEKKSTYQTMVSELNLPHIYFYGFVDRRVSLMIIGLADVAVHSFNRNPHWDYVLGNKVFDYMAMGTPVLFSGRGTTAKLVLDSKGGLVSEPENVQDFSEKLNILLFDPDTKACGERGRDYVNKHWRRSDHVRRFVDSLRSWLCESATL
jgi:glycosyltransferase involved in cell wall biosynthesis